MLTCGVCYSPFDWEEFRPSCASPCGHFICKSCKRKLEEKICPFCKVQIDHFVYPWDLRETVTLQSERIKRRREKNAKKNKKRRNNRRVKMLKLAETNSQLTQQLSAKEAQLAQMLEVSVKLSPTTSNTCSFRPFSGKGIIIGSNNY